MEVLGGTETRKKVKVTLGETEARQTVE